jgi:hypothetical protein
MPPPLFWCNLTIKSLKKKHEILGNRIEWNCETLSQTLDEIPNNRRSYGWCRIHLNLTHLQEIRRNSLRVGPERERGWVEAWNTGRWLRRLFFHPEKESSSRPRSAGGLLWMGRGDQWPSSQTPRWAPERPPTLSPIPCGRAAALRLPDPAAPAPDLAAPAPDPAAPVPDPPAPDPTPPASALPRAALPQRLRGPRAGATALGPRDVNRISWILGIW